MPIEEFNSPKLLRYYTTVAEGLHPKVHKALLAGITSGKLLALRRYLLAGPKKIEKNWAWDAEQERDFKADRSRYDAMEQALKKVKDAFQARCAGCTLHAKTEARNYERQLELWNQNEKKNGLEEKLRVLAREELVDEHYPDDPKPHDPSLHNFGEFLIKNGSPEILGGTTTNAPPGLSDHGQLTAFDFVVMKNGHLVAGTSTNKDYMRINWEQSGYAKSLKEAAEEANKALKPAAMFEGPLRAGRLYEPWHYKYVIQT